MNAERLGDNRLTQIRLGFEQMVKQGYPLGPYGMELFAHIAALESELSEARGKALEEAAAWHDQRRRDTPDAFEMELHEVSAKAIRALKVQAMSKDETENQAPDWYDDEDDDNCAYCGGDGFLEGECACGDDCCCCLEPEPPPCPHCTPSQLKTK
jgi:hypothetical protein